MAGDIRGTMVRWPLPTTARTALRWWRAVTSTSSVYAAVAVWLDSVDPTTW